MMAAFMVAIVEVIKLCVKDGILEYLLGLFGPMLLFDVLILRLEKSRRMFVWTLHHLGDQSYPYIHFALHQA